MAISGKRCNSFILTAVLIAGGRTAAANPDAPVGTIILEPQYVRDDKGTSDHGDLNSTLGMRVAVPVSSYLTIRAGVYSVQYSQRFGNADTAGSFVFVSSLHRTNFELSARVYIPLTSKAERVLRTWDSSQ